MVTPCLRPPRQDHADRPEHVETLLIVALAEARKSLFDCGKFLTPVVARLHLHRYRDHESRVAIRIQSCRSARMYDLYSSNPQPAGANVCRERISGTDQMVGSLEIHTSGAN